MSNFYGVPNSTNQTKAQRSDWPVCKWDDKTEYTLVLS